MKKEALRDVFGKYLVELGKRYKDLIVVSCDLKSATKTVDFFKEYPDRSFEVGIAEANGLGISAGLALSYLGQVTIGLLTTPPLYVAIISIVALSYMYNPKKPSEILSMVGESISDIFEVISQYLPSPHTRDFIAQMIDPDHRTGDRNPRDPEPTSQFSRANSEPSLRSSNAM